MRNSSWLDRVQCWSGADALDFRPVSIPIVSRCARGYRPFLLDASFVLIRQNAIDRASERRNHLDLQINLLAEEEATKVLKIRGEIAVHLKLPVHDPDNKDLSTYAGRFYCP